METQRYYEAITTNFPALRITSGRPFHAGWGHDTLLVNEQLVFRFPRHADQAQTFLREVRLRQELAPLLPLPVPHYLYIGQPTAAFPFVFGGYPLLPGITLSQCAAVVSYQ